MSVGISLHAIAPSTMTAVSNGITQTGSLIVSTGEQRNVKYEKYKTARTNIQKRTEEVRRGCTARCYRHTSRGFRNFLRVGLAATCSCVGGLIAGSSGVFGGVIISLWLGSATSGAANGCSTVFAYETDSEVRGSDLEHVVAMHDQKIAQYDEQIALLREEIATLRGRQTSTDREYKGDMSPTVPQDPSLHTSAVAIHINSDV